MSANDFPTHGDILVQIGELKGQVSTLITLVGEKRDDINAAFTRISTLEKSTVSREELSEAVKPLGALRDQVSKWGGVCLAITFALPFVVPYITKFIVNAERSVLNKPAP
jgi:hypothetical protein